MEEQYQRAINPKTLFKSLDDLRDFLEIPCTKKDLQCMLEIFEEEELYEECEIIFQKMNSLSK